MADYLKSIDFKDLLNDVTAPVIIARPLVSEGEEISEKTDFLVFYMNKSANVMMQNLMKTGQKYSEFKDSLPQGINWGKITAEVLRENKTNKFFFYSILSSKYLQATCDPVSGGNVVIEFTDVTEEKETELQLKRQNERLASLTEELSSLNEQLKTSANTDFMTGLPSRVKFRNDVLKLIEEYSGTDKKFGVMLLDLDNLKEINDSKGRDFGDSVIKKTAKVLGLFESKDIHIYRNDGDEFLVVVENLASKDRMITVGDSLLETVNTHRIKFSAGISIFPDDATKFEDLQKFADMAMYTVKKHGRNNFTFFQMSMHENFMDKLNLLAKLNSAVTQNVFQQYYQPQYDIVSGALRGFEALIRWHDKDLGWISPQLFIDLAEETKLILPIGKWVLEQALSTLEKWTNEYNFNGIMSVNVSPLQLKEESFLDDLKALMKKHGTNANKLELEITEGVLIENPENIIEILQEIRNLGVGISLDDFGTGYSSLSYLRMLPITTLKIDKSFIDNITAEGGVEANITDSIISMVTKMGLDTIAEGVEHQEQLDILKGIKCHTVQGYLKGKPMTSENCEEILKAR